ncbi:MAG: CvpA family protein [Candidatus Omnitrophica bacterium]|nr:CvpA family protein [Candidatus Omnitrophota bacterium]
MLLNILKQINWVDIFVLILTLRVCSIAVKNGFPVELFKLAGTLTAVYLALHYYLDLAEYLKGWLSFGGKMPLKFLEFLIFFALAAGAYYLFILLRNIFSRFLKMEAVSALNKWGSLLLGIARAALLASLIMFMLVISSIGYFGKSVKESYSGQYLFSLAPDTYAWIWNSVISKFSVAEKYNAVIPSIKEEVSRNK